MSVMSNFDVMGDFVIPENIFEGVREIAKESATSSINVELSRMFARKADPNATTNGRKASAIFFVTSVKFNGKRGLSTGGGGIFESEVVVEGIVGPKCCRKIRTM
jgi:hypothetical protein